MQVVSEKFKQAMVNCPYIARITVQGEEPLRGDAVRSIVFRSGSNSGENTILLGSTFSGSVEITLDKSLVTCVFENRELTVELGMSLSDGIEWLPMGTYIADDPVDDEDTLTVTARDVLSAKLDVDYEPLENIDFTSAAGASSVAVWKALCARRGIKTDIDGLAAIQLEGSPEGFTERQIVGFIAALYGGFAYVDRLGVLRIGFYQVANARITPDEYYSDGLEQASYGFSVGWLKCYNEAADLTMFVGDFDAAQGINLASIWMSQAILNGLWERFENFSYRPVSNLSVLGNPLIDPGDIVEVEDTSGEVFSVPAMTITHEYDGGLITSLTACGQAVTSEYTGPTRRAVARGIASAKQHADDKDAKLDQLELLKRLTNSWVDDGIYLAEDLRIAINASAIRAGVLNAGLLKTGIIESEDGTVKIDLSTNTITVDTLVEGHKGKLELSAAGVSLYGLDSVSGIYQKTLMFTPGAHEESANHLASILNYLTGLNIYSDTGISLRSLGDILLWGAQVRVGLPSGETPVYIHGKQVSWRDNGDGTSTLIGI